MYILIHKYSFPDEHTTIIFILYYINKKALVWRTEFIVAYTVSGQEIYLRTIEDFFAALDSVFQLFNMAGDILLQMFCNLFIYLNKVWTPILQYKPFAKDLIIISKYGLK